MVAALSGDQFLFGRLTNGVEVVPDHLHGLVVGLRAGVGKHRLLHAQVPGFFNQPVRQLNRGLVGTSRKQLVVGQAVHLPGGSLGQPRLRKTQGGAPQARHTLQITPALVVFHINAIAPGDHQRPGFSLPGQRCVGVKQGVDVLLGIELMGTQHGFILSTRDHSHELA